jgi:hypothetical protein
MIWGRLELIRSVRVFVMQASVVVIRLIKRQQIINGNNSQVASKEDLVFALQNNLLNVNELELA